MSLVYQSAQSATVVGTSLVITKPASLAVGDYMFAVIGYQNPITSAPAGWSVIATQASPGSRITIKVYFIKATSTEVAASNFTWESGSNAIVGGIIRVTGDAHSSPVAIFAQNTSTATTTPSYAISVTPDDVDSLLLYFVGSGAATGAISASGYAIATSNPTWAEAFDITVDSGGGGALQLSLAYATRSQITATGNASLTFSGAWESSAIMIVMRPQIVADLSETESVVDTLNKGITKEILETESALDILDTSKNRKWDFTSKNSDVWVDTSKN